MVQNHEGAITIKVDGVTLKGSGPFEVVLQNGRVVGELPDGVSLSALSADSNEYVARASRTWVDGGWLTRRRGDQAADENLIRR